MDRSELLRNIAENELLQFLGVKIEIAEPDHVVMTMEVTPRVHQYAGIMNGGVSLYLCETAASVGVVAGADLTKVTPVGIEINANHVRAVSRGKITVEGRPIYPGRSLSVWGIEITNERGKLVCTSRCSIIYQRHSAIRSET